MGLWQKMVMAFLTGCLCVPAVAQQVDNVTFSNSDGIINGTSLSSGSLSLSSSTLMQISGFTGGLGAVVDNQQLYQVLPDLQIARVFWSGHRN